MIIGEDEPVHVSNTNIFVGKLASDGVSSPRQFTVYSNIVQSQNVNANDVGIWSGNRAPMPTIVSGNGPFELPSNRSPQTNNMAMILPVPSTGKWVKNKPMIEFYAMDGKYEEVFSKLESLFPAYEKLQRQSFSYNAGADGISEDEEIEVHQVGSYDVSIVPSLDKFDYLQHDIFELDKGFQSLLKRDYNQGYAFVVCKLRNGEKFHPIAYSHPMTPDGKLFIPTKHYHNKSESGADWDHSIYILNGDVNNSINFTPGLNYRESMLHHQVIDTPFVQAPATKIGKLAVDWAYKNNHDLLISVH